MERYTQTTVDKLKIDDRFYKVGDKQKTVFQMIASEPAKTQYRSYRHFCVEARIMDATLITLDKKLNQKQAILSGTLVVFLRNVSA